MLQQLVNGLILGSVYALLALGYTMVYGIIKLINFAHGDIYMMGAFIGYFLSFVLYDYRHRLPLPMKKLSRVVILLLRLWRVTHFSVKLLVINNTNYQNHKKEAALKSSLFLLHYVFQVILIYFSAF